MRQLRHVSAGQFKKQIHRVHRDGFVLFSELGADPAFDVRIFEWRLTAHDMRAGA